MAGRRRSRRRALFEPGFAAKSSMQQAEKDAIADAAVALVEPGMAIGVSAGTTTYALAQRLADVPGLTVVTNSTRVADVLHEVGRADQTIILTGGVRTPSEALVGPFAVAALRTVHVDLVFVGVHGMDPHSGFTCPNLLEADTDRALIEAGRRLDRRRGPLQVGRHRHQLDRAARPGGHPHHRRRHRRRRGPGAPGRGPAAHDRGPGRCDGGPHRSCHLIRWPTVSCRAGSATTRTAGTTRSSTSGCWSPRAAPSGHGWAPRSRRSSTTGRPISPIATSARGTPGRTAIGTLTTTPRSSSTTTSRRSGRTRPRRPWSTASSVPKANVVSAAWCASRPATT